MLGTIGSFLVLAAFVASILSGVAFFKAAAGCAVPPRTPPRGGGSGRGGLARHDGGDARPFAMLVYAFATHQYQYAYVYQNSSNDLPAYFTLSATWAGQEGSFLLWIVLNALLGRPSPVGHA
jgi:cytochrome c-type biogenesis protein CcmF